MGVVNTVLAPNMKLRSTDDADLAKKDSELTYLEMDTNLIAIKNGLKYLEDNAGVQFPLYDAGLSYSEGDYVVFNDGTYWGTYRANAPISAGQTPLSSSSLWNNIGIGKDYVGSIIKISISASQIKTAYSSPVSLVAAPGSGKLIVPDKIVLAFDPGGEAFNSLSVMVGSDLSNPIFKEGILNQSTALKIIMRASDNALVVNENSALKFGVDSDSSTGNGTITLYLFYNTTIL